MLNRELGFFILNGIISVALAYAVYWLLVFEAGFDISLANGIAYITGMTYGFFANKALSFQDRGRVTTAKVARYVLLHLFTLIVNVSVNLMVLESIQGVYGAMLIAFMVAISISTILNFLGLKYLVFAKVDTLSVPTKTTRTLLP